MSWPLPYTFLSECLFLFLIRYVKYHDLHGGKQESRKSNYTDLVVFSLHATLVNYYIVYLMVYQGFTLGITYAQFPTV
jgi:hypothetical protein